MRRAMAIAKKEWRAAFLSPVALIFLGIFLTASLVVFFFFQGFFARNLADARPFFQGMPILLVLLTSAFTMRLWSEEARSGTLEVLFLSPTPILASLVMSTLWRYCWAFAESLFYLLVAGIFFQAHLDWANVLLAMLVVLLTIFANAGLGFINASFVLVTKQTSPLARLLGLVTNLLAGVYYPIEVLPNWLQGFSRLLPATYSFDALRRTMLQSVSLVDVRQDLLALAVFTVVLLPIGLVAFHYAVRWAKIDGSLSQY